MIYIRSFIANVVFYLLLLFGVFLSVVFSWWTPKSWTVKMWNNILLPLNAFLLKYTAGIEIELRGVENILETPALYASKHQSAFETYFLTSVVKKGLFVMKKELTYIPLFGWAFYFYGMIAVNRQGASKAMKQMLKDGKERLKDGRSIIIFPEGTRLKPNAPPQYKSGVSFMYQNLNVPVVPIACNTGYFWGKSSFLRKKGKMIFEFLPAIEPNQYKKEFLSELENRIETACKKLNEETVKNNPKLKEGEYNEKK
ncbi:MAG: lysophospholipid acyltransferase family protein [Alphaproteobacteria bacterium]